MCCLDRLHLRDSYELRRIMTMRRDLLHCTVNLSLLIAEVQTKPLAVAALGARGANGMAGVARLPDADETRPPPPRCSAIRTDAGFGTRPARASGFASLRLATHGMLDGRHSQK